MIQWHGITYSHINMFLDSLDKNTSGKVYWLYCILSVLFENKIMLIIDD